MDVSEYVMPILKARYLRDGESPTDMLLRVANFIASNEKDPQYWASKFFDVMNRRDFMPSSPFLMNAGTDYPMLSACFVLDVPDDMAGIFQAIKDMALIQQRGGGTGFNFSKVREKGAVVRSTNGVASGVLSFLEVFNAATNIVKQGGRRRGANIAILDVDHPEIEDFINSKLEDGRLSNFNISVRISDEFMRAVLDDKYWDLHSRVDGHVVRQVRAADLMNMLLTNASKNGEPGFLFVDNIERSNLTPQFGPITGVNPCGEVSLYDKEACNLGSINLENFVDVFKDAATFERFANTVKTAVRFLDNSIDLNRFPVPEISETVKRTRKLGLGVSGLAAWLIMNGYRYDSKEGVEAAGRLIGTIEHIAIDESTKLGEEKGYLPYTVRGRKARNVTLTSIAPTGTISMIMGTSSSGIEPVFGFTYERRIGEEMYHVEVPMLRSLLSKYGIEPTENVIRDIENNGGSIASLPFVPDELKELAKTNMEITAEAQLDMLAELQKYVDNNISKTIIIPWNFKNQDLWKKVVSAWELGVRGFTIYRDGSRKNQVIQLQEKCPVCGAPVVIEDGCKHCPSCGWSTCSL